jgi:hypothetical protein
MKKLAATLILVPTILAALLILSAQTSVLAQSATPTASRITISGQVTMGTPGLTLPVTTSLLLHAHDEHEMALMLNGQADAQGVLRFEGLENKPGRTFDVMATVGPTVYSAEQISPQAGQSEYKAAITIYGTTKDTSKLRVERLHNFVEFINRQQVRTTEIYVLSNGGDRTIEGGETTADAKAVTLRFNLPAGAEQVRFDGGEIGTRFFRTPDGFLDAQGVPPGQRSSQVMVSYVLPYAGRVHLEHQVNYPVLGTDVILPAGAGITLAGNGLQAHGMQQAPNGTAMQIFSGTELPSGARLAYDLSGELSASQASLLDGGAAQDGSAQVPAGALGSLAWTLRTSVGGSPLSSALTGFGMLLIAVALFWWLRMRAGRSAAESIIWEPGTDHSALIQAIADLDDAQAAGQIDLEEYRQQRRRLLNDILTLPENTQRRAALAGPEA